VGRRGVLLGAAAAGAAALAGFPAVHTRAQQQTLKVGTYGGYFAS